MAGQVLRSTSAARCPSPVKVGGMRTSTTTTSGWWSPTSRRNSSACPASEAGRTPGCPLALAAPRAAADATDPPMSPTESAGRYEYARLRLPHVTLCDRLCPPFDKPYPFWAG